MKDASEAETWLLADPDSFEEEACQESVTITMDQNGITRIEKSGGNALNAQQRKFQDKEKMLKEMRIKRMADAKQKREENKKKRDQKRFEHVFRCWAPDAFERAVGQG